MLSDVMDYYSLTRDFRDVGYFETEHHQQVFKELKVAIKQGQMVALSGIVGCGKTTTLKSIRQELINEKEVLVSKSLSVEKGRVNLVTLILALFCDLATEKDFKIPSQPEKRERMLQVLIKKRQKPIALFIDEAHDLHSKTLIGLKRLIEVIQDGDVILSNILAGHPKLKNDLRRPAMEEIGSRTSIFNRDGIQGKKNEYIRWLLEKCLKKNVKPVNVFTDDALEPVLTRHGYNVKALAELLDTKPTEIRSFLHGKLAPTRTQELQNSLLVIGIPM